MTAGADDAWARLRAMTPARIALGRAGSGVPTAEVLRFGLAHAEARDAVHATLDVDRLQRAIEALAFDVVQAESAAPDRTTYLTRPDLGRQLSKRARATIKPAKGKAAPDLGLIVADGLSARAVNDHAVGFLVALKPWIAAAGWTTGPLIIARQARVALGDEVGARLKARAVIVLIGERPGLSSPDSLGIYLTIMPRPGRTDAERNCISNVRPAGLSNELAAYKLAWLLNAAFERGLTGVALKDESDTLLIAGRPPQPRLPHRPDL